MATAATATSSLYEVLGLQMNASSHEIKTAYRRLAKSCHPDVVAMNQKQSSAIEFMKLHAAYTTLSDPNKRANYDKGLYQRCARPFRSSSASMAAANAYRNWETDQCW